MLHPDRHKAPIGWGPLRPRRTPAEWHTHLQSHWDTDWHTTPVPPGWWLVPAVLFGAAIWASGAAVLMAMLGG